MGTDHQPGPRADGGVLVDSLRRAGRRADVEAADLLGASVMLFPDGVLSNPEVSPDLVEAAPLKDIEE